MTNSKDDHARITFAEPVRLVIWDLDDTFWDGTLTEGGIRYRPANHEIVLELARRGIMSSICSKNDHSTVEQVLREKGLWDYFIFPSINWEPKGRRVKATVDAIQLRAASVLFIDDNKVNLEEARFICPDLQLATPSILTDLLVMPELQGKADPDLSRLKQYKVLEQRHSALADIGGDNLAFLRNSKVRVHIEHDVERHLDRAIELINRTNQLNFTKNRLPEDSDAARLDLTKLLRRNTSHAAIISVKDRFGDHGQVGLFVCDRILGVVHFCFSCRILGLHVERWLYNYLGRPRLDVKGDVLSDIFAWDPAIDWISASAADGENDDEETEYQGGGFRYPSVFARGGCDIASLTHYFSPIAKSVSQESNFQRSGLSIRIDHSLVLLHSLEGVTPPMLGSLQRLGYTEEDFQTRLLGSSTGIKILSFWADASVPIYRHKTLGFLIPFWLIGAQARNLVADTSLDPVIATTPEACAALAALRNEYDFVGVCTQEQMLKSYFSIIGRLPDPSRTVVLLANELGSVEQNGVRPRHAGHVAYNCAMQEVAKRFRGLHLIDVMDYITEPADQHDLNHFSRMVYQKIASGIVSATQKWMISRGVRQGARGVSVAQRSVRGVEAKTSYRPREKHSQSQAESRVTPQQITVMQNDVRQTLKALQGHIRTYSIATGQSGAFLFDQPAEPPRQDLLGGAQLLTNRYELLRRLPKGGLAAEIGTLKGAFAQEILKTVQPEELHIFDITFDRLSPAAKSAFTAHGKVTLHEGKSWEQLKLMPDRYFDWVYIDGDHSLAGVELDAVEAMRVVKPNGLIVFNDYMMWSPINMQPYGVQSVVNRLVNRFGLQVIYVALESRGYNDIAVRLPSL